MARSVGGAIAYRRRGYLGSVAALTDADGNVVWRQSTDAWGGHPQTSGTLQNRRGLGGDQGYERKGCGLIDAGLRAYDVELGRFLQQDPVGDATGQ